MAKILVVEDSPETLEALKAVLLGERHSPDCVLSAAEAWDFIQTYQYDAMVVDWEMPGMSGVELIRKYRSSGGQAPVIMLTGKSSTPDKVSGLDSGADYYLTKPLVGSELLGFIRAALRRSPTPESNVLKFGNLQLCSASATVSCGGASLNLSSRELAVLETLMKNSSRIVSHDELKEAGWSDQDSLSSGAVRVFLSSLRQKLDALDAQVKIVSVRGFGYRIEI